LRQLEFALGFFGFYRRFVDHYNAITEPLTQLKIKGFKGVPIGGYGRERYAETTLLTSLASAEKLKKYRVAFKNLKELLCKAPTLTYPDFTRGFVLYVDGSKKKKYGTALYQLDNSDLPIKKSIFYISKILTAAERRYWPTKLETGALI
jgi:hypothetical protein